MILTHQYAMCKHRKTLCIFFSVFQIVTDNFNQSLNNDFYLLLSFHIIFFLHHFMFFFSFSLYSYQFPTCLFVAVNVLGKTLHHKKKCTFLEHSIHSTSYEYENFGIFKIKRTSSVAKEILTK